MPRQLAAPFSCSMIRFASRQLSSRGSRILKWTDRPSGTAPTGLRCRFSLELNMAYTIPF